jgi:hypothetical protein
LEDISKSLAGGAHIALYVRVPSCRACANKQLHTAFVWEQALKNPSANGLLRAISAYGRSDHRQSKLPINDLNAEVPWAVGKDATAPRWRSTEFSRNSSI